MSDWSFEPSYDFASRQPWVVTRSGQVFIGEPGGLHDDLLADAMIDPDDVEGNGEIHDGHVTQLKPLGTDYQHLVEEALEEGTAHRLSKTKKEPTPFTIDDGYVSFLKAGEPADGWIVPVGKLYRIEGIDPSLHHHVHRAWTQHKYDPPQLKKQADDWSTHETHPTFHADMPGEAPGMARAMDQGLPGPQEGNGGLSDPFELEWLPPSSTAETVVARAQGKTIGLLTIIPTETIPQDHRAPDIGGQKQWSVYTVQVNPEYQRQGVATAMLNYARQKHEIGHSTVRTEQGEAWANKVGSTSRQHGIKVAEFAQPIGNLHWVYLNGKVAFDQYPWRAARTLALELYPDKVDHIENTIARNDIPKEIPCALGEVIQNRPQIWLSNIDRNHVWDEVMRAIEANPQSPTIPHTSPSIPTTNRRSSSAITGNRLISSFVPGTRVQSQGKQGVVISDQVSATGAYELNVQWDDGQLGWVDSRSLQPEYNSQQDWRDDWRTGRSKFGFFIFAADLETLAQQAYERLKNREDIARIMEKGAQSVRLLENGPEYNVWAFMRHLESNWNPSFENPIPVETYKMWEWAVGQIKRGGINYAQNGAHLRDIMVQATKWMQWCQEYHKPIPDWKRKDFDFAAMEQWVYEMNSQNVDKDSQWQNEKVIYKWPDGWYMAEVSAEDCPLEGELMGHCVGGYGNEISSGRSYIVSLRDPKGNPHTTLEMIGPKPDNGGYKPRYDDETAWKVQQIQGKQDREPVPEYQQRVKEWFNSLKEEGLDIQWGRGSVQHDVDDEPEYEYDYDAAPYVEVKTLPDVLNALEKIKSEGMSSFYEDYYTGDYKTYDGGHDEKYDIPGAASRSEYVIPAGHIDLHGIGGFEGLTKLWAQLIQEILQGKHDAEDIAQYCQGFYFIVKADQYQGSYIDEYDLERKPDMWAIIAKDAMGSPVPVKPQNTPSGQEQLFDPSSYPVDQGFQQKAQMQGLANYAVEYIESLYNGFKRPADAYIRGYEEPHHVEACPPSVTPRIPMAFASYLPDTLRLGAEGFSRLGVATITAMGEWYEDPDKADWQHGLCDTYAKAMLDMYPHLRLGILHNGEGIESHWFAHDDTHAYDSLGRHPLAYTGYGDNIGKFEQRLDADPEDYGFHWPDFYGENGSPEDYERAKRLIPQQHPWLSERTAMAERTGDPELDKLIEQFMSEEREYLMGGETDPENRMDYRNPNDAAGECGEVSEFFRSFLRKRGINATCTADADWNRSPDEQTPPTIWGTPDAHGYGDRAIPGYDDHVAVIAQMPSGSYMIDWTASQYGYKEFPMVQKLDGDQWQREF